MRGSLLQLLVEQPMMRIVRGLLASPAPRHLRDLASTYGLSASGVADIIRRLIKTGVVSEFRRGNRRYFSLNIEPHEVESLRAYFKAYEFSFVERRSHQFEKRAIDKLSWMDETLVFYQRVKRKNYDTT